MCYGVFFEHIPLVGESVHFGELNEILCVAANVESAMALCIATNGLPCWVCLGPTGVRTLKPPEKVRKVLIFFNVA